MVEEKVDIGNSESPNGQAVASNGGAPPAGQGEGASKTPTATPNASPAPAKRSGPKLPITPVNLVLVGLFAAGLLAVYLLSLRAGPQEASADEKTTEARVDAALTEIKKSSTSKMDETEAVVDTFYYEASQRQIPLYALPVNPFLYVAAPGVTVDMTGGGGDAVNASHMQEKDDLRAALEALYSLQLQTVLMGSSTNRSTAIISNNLVAEGQQVNGWTVKSIQAKEVILKWKDHERHPEDAALTPPSIRRSVQEEHEFVSRAVKEKSSAGSQSSPGETVDFADLWQPAEGGTTYRGPERILLETGHITPEQLEAAVSRQRENPRLSLLEAFVENGAIEEMLALQAVSEYFQLPFYRVTPEDVDPDVVGMLPQDYIKNKQVLPIRWDEDAIIVGLSDPADIFLIDDLKRRINHPIHLVVTPSEDIHNTVDEIGAPVEQQVDEIIKDISEDAVEVVDETSDEVADLERIAGESPVIRYVNFLISSATSEGASDIHIEPGERKMRVRYRIDGVLFEQQAPPVQMHAAIVSRLKIMANLDIAERRLPQDGRIRATVHGRTVDLRVSTLPIAHGEKCVIRILDNRSITVGLEQLGMSEHCLASVRHQILQPHGIVLVTGPTGSGKTTTLYSAMQVMDGDRLNISTVEDPVEYELDFTNQVGVHESIGMTFSAALRSLLRQDPDVIMLGEIRDEETARIAIQASLTGHLVLSTLHTNDAPSSITRIINIGIEPYLISAAVNAVVAQRLVRRICDDCKQPATSIPDHIKAYLDKFNYSVETLYQGAGCEKCRQTGFKGRLGLYEFLELDEEMRDLVTTNPSLGDLRRAAVEHGMLTLREDGLQKATTGQTTIDEIMRVTET